LPDLSTVLNDVIFEITVVIIYVAVFGYFVYGSSSWKTQAFAPELSTIAVVLYAKTVWELFPKYFELANRDISASSDVVDGLFQVGELLLLCGILPFITVSLVLNQVSAYHPKPEPDLNMVWRANLYAIAACFALNPFAAYISYWAKKYVPG